MIITKMRKRISFGMVFLLLMEKIPTTQLTKTVPINSVTYFHFLVGNIATIQHIRTSVSLTIFCNNVENDKLLAICKKEKSILVKLYLPLHHCHQ